MSLAGSLDEFALPDILSLLAVTSSRGLLRIDGPGVALDLPVRGEFLVEADGGSLSPAIRDILGCRGARFDWLPDDLERPGTLIPSTALIGDIDAHVAAEAEMTSIVPSGSHRLTLGAAPAGELLLDLNAWSVVRAVGDGSSMDFVVDRCQAEPLSTYRTVRTLLANGVLELHPPLDAGDRNDAPEPLQARPAAFHSPIVSPVVPEPVAATPSGLDPALDDRGPWPADQLASMVAEAHDEESGWPAGAERTAHPDGQGRAADRGVLLRFFSTVKA